MKFNKEIFKNNFGFYYIKAMRNLIITDIVLILIIIFIYIINITIPFALAVFILAIIALSFFPILPLVFSYYIKALNMSKRQKQWIDSEGKINLIVVPEDGFTWGGMVTHKKYYVIQSISNIFIKRKYIIIEGNISFVDSYNGYSVEKNISICKIPRNFTNEDKILNIKSD